ncbi:hypothetical protein SUGI_0805390 [Cryptomeria japonica]|nr:hypothetical protein SUGI_0805390 [Cryptomeria japonica]
MEKARSIDCYIEALNFFDTPDHLKLGLVISVILTVVIVVGNLLLSGEKKEEEEVVVEWPPCPPRLPLLGNLRQLRKSGNVLSAFTDMAKSCGPVMTVWIGTSPLVVLTGQAAIWEALVTQASNFSGRPPLYYRQFTSASYRTIISSPYIDENWIRLRKLVHNHVFSPAHVALQSFSHKASVNKLIKNLKKEMKEKNGVVKPFYALKMMAMSFIAPLCFGPDFQDENLLSQLEEFVTEDMSLTRSADMFLDSFPFARFLVPSSIKTERNFKSLRANVLHLLLPIIRSAHSYREYLKQRAPNCYLNCLLSIGEGEEEMGEDNPKFSDEEIAFNLYELFLLAVDSTSTAIEWALAYLITNPHIQERVYQEISQEIQKGEGGLLNLEDLGKLPYLQGVVKETLRKESFAPVGVSRQTLKECKVMGITIPAKSVVLFNLHGVANDPEVWKEPEEFRPERFMGKNELERARMAYLPFGAGKRVCPAIDVSNVYVPITLANLVKVFKWECVSEGNTPDLSRDVPTLLMWMKYPLEARMMPRSS